MDDVLITAPRAAALAGATTNQLENLVQQRVIVPTRESTRRGEVRMFDQRTFADLTVAIELINCYMPSKLVHRAVLRLSGIRRSGRN